MQQQPNIWQLFQGIGLLVTIVAVCVLVGWIATTILEKFVRQAALSMDRKLKKEYDQAQDQILILKTEISELKVRLHKERCPKCETARTYRN